MKNFYRKDSRFLLGIFEGLGEYIGIDTNILRIIIIAIIIFFPSTFCTISLIYTIVGMLYEQK